MTTVTVAGDIATDFHPTVSIACDRSSGTLAVATEYGDGSIRVFLSNDGGAAWSQKASFTDDEYTLYGPSVVLANDNLFLAYTGDGLKYVKGPLSADSKTWIAKDAPEVSGVDVSDYSVAPSLALDSAGNPGVAWWARDLNSDYNQILLFWKPDGGAAPVKIMDSENNGTDPAVKLVYFGLDPRVLAYVQRNDAEFGVGLHTSKSDDGGISWGTPIVIPPDGESSTDYPFDLTVDSQGRAAVFYGQNGSTGTSQCGNPKLSRSDDFIHWTTCAAGPLDVTGDYSPYPASLQAAFGGNDRLYLFWWDTAGIIMYREPPASAITGPTISSVSNGATHQDGVVPGSWVEVKGVNLAGTTRLWGETDFNNGDTLPTALSGVQVKINGLLAPVYYISPTQINVQAPADISGTVTVQVINNGVPSNTLNVATVQTSPGLFFYTLSGRNFPSALYNGTSTIVGDPALYPQLAKARAGDIIQLYGTGLGPSPAGSLVKTPIVFSNPVTVMIGSTSVIASYAGLVGVGLFQINFTVPSLPDGDYPITIQTGGKSSPGGIVFPITH